jgi:hypothetical protein
MTKLNNETRELNINELDTVAGGLQRIPTLDASYQQQAAQNGASNTVGGSLTDAANTFVFTGGFPGQGLGYKG